MQATNWNEVEEAQEFENPTAGGYVCRIIDVKDVPERQYLLVTLDIAEGKFTDRGKELQERTGADWGYYVAYRSYKESARSFFKSFLVALEKSNKRFKANKFNNNEKELIGLLVGVVLQEEEYVGQDKETKAPKKKTRLRVANTIDANLIRAGKFKVPALKVLSDEDKARLSESSYMPFSDVNAVAEDINCPF